MATPDSPAPGTGPARLPAASGPTSDGADERVGGVAIASDTGDTAADRLFPEGDAASGRSECKKRRGGNRTPASTTQRALALLVRREHSARELTRKLVARGLDPDEVRESVDRLADAGWQDDTRFAESLVRSRAASGYGPIHVRAELGTHGLDSAAVDAAMGSFDGDWTEQARDLARRRCGPPRDDLAWRRKVADLLARRGFPGDVIRTVSRFDPDDVF
ncbi:recombination regulator RecX [Lysobacter sp. 13A]|uniref:Regulatory protein RecX n=1 Tax=Novilysobacter selenitireducens TaxID=2872639 RepID=A0ABS7T7J9_9GAMM|nr:recombination regulator RecX [Lysobacter selenitireducens]